MIIDGELQESSKKSILRAVSQQDTLQDNPSETSTV